MRIGIVVLSLASVFFQLLFAIGGQIGSFGLMLAARILFGIASRSIFIPQTSLISFWFKGKELSFALGIGITCPELGNALNSYLTPIIYEKTGSLGPPLFTSVGFCIVGFICAIFVSRMDKRAEQVIKL
jgi:MFS family permease